MVGELIMLPVRVGVRATRIWFRAVEETVSLTAGTAGRLIEALNSRGSDGAAGVASSPRRPDAFRPPATAPTRSAPKPAPASEPAPARKPRPAPAADTGPSTEQSAVDTPPIAEPTHVSEEPTLVEEFSEPGAEEGAGAEVHVDPPWDGYRQMNAKEILARVAGADSAELAAVELYEATNRRRQTILNAVGRELRRVNGSGSRGNQTQRG